MDQKGGVSITLAPNSTYNAEDLVIHRKYKGEHDENLVKWTRSENKGKDAPQGDAEEKTSKEYLIWMRRPEMEACCPHLLSLEGVKSVPTAAQAASALQQPRMWELPEGDDSLHEMAEDINNLVLRAQRIMRKSGQKPGGAGVKMLSNTISILSAYAKIGALANIFRESGAMDILLSLLSSQDLDVRRSASDMLRSLATYDSGSRAYVLLQLTRSDSGQAARSTDQSRQMVLDLFAETASGDESELFLSGITLPPVPGRFIFSLLKKYLRVTSLTKNYTVSTPLPVIDNSPVPESEFELFYAMYQLITELFSVFSWFEGTLEERVQKGATRILKGLSIFTGTVPTEEAFAAPKKKKKNPYKRREDFMSDREYGQYVKATLQNGMRVRARVNYESVSEGDYGTYKQTNEGTPPAQFAWDGLGGDTYWLYWHQVEILPPASAEDKDENPAATMAAFQQPTRQPYVMRSLAMPTTSRQERFGDSVNQAFWWEILCLLKPLPPIYIETTISLLGIPTLKTFDDLIHFVPTYPQVAEVLQHLEGDFPHLAQEPLSIKEMSRFRTVYHDQTLDIAPAKDISQIDGLGPSVEEGPYKKEAPYIDPYDLEEPIHSPIFRDFPASLEDAPLSLIRTLSGYLRHRREESDPVSHISSLEHLQDGSLSQVMSTKEVVEKYIEKHPQSSRIATQALRALRNGSQLMKSETDRQELCVTGFFSLILRLMRIEPKSCILQCIGLDCFFALMGSFGIHQSLPRPNSERERKQELLSEPTQSLIIATVLSLSSSTEYGGLKSVVDAMSVVLEQYNLGMNATQKRNCVLAIRNGLCILVALLSDTDTQKKMEGWGIPELLDGILKRFPDFSIKLELCQRIAAVLPGCSEIEDPSETLKSPDAIKMLTREIVSVIKTFRKSEDIYSRNPIPRLLKLMDHDVTTNDPFRKPHSSFVSLFLMHKGVFYLTTAMEANRSSTFIENALTLLGSLIRFGEEEAAEVVLQGGLRAVVTCMNAYPGNKTIQKLCLLILQLLVKDPDHLVITGYENVSPALRNAKEKYSTDDELCRLVTDLTEQCNSGETSRVILHQKILSIIFSGVLQMILTSIEEARRSRQLINMPKFSAFIKYLSASSGGTVSVGDKEKWWEKIEVSSNTQKKERLVDNDTATYWESSGRSGTHWVRIYMKKGLVVRRMAIEVKSSDSSYMPQRVTVQGGTVPDNVQDISTVYIPTAFTGSYEIVTNVKRHYPVIVIRIKRCQQGGIDARIHEITCQAARSSLWPVFGDLFSIRSKLFYHIQVQTWLKDSTLGPLELFDKLSSVVLHEQVFADNFFMTPPARQCLGQACRSALITPLIETLTKQSESGPNLRKLIHEYIVQMQPPLASQWRALTNTTEHGDVEVMSFDDETFDFSKAQSRLVHMSRIRRMCRLLVDCDDNITSKKSLEESEEKEEGEESDLPTSSPPITAGMGTVAMARCWRDIVHLEVTQVLRKFDYTNSPHAVASDVLNMYDQLKQAMLELFGGHSQFALALKEGFSRAFQSLDEVTGVRFCELLCLCIDSLMDVAGKDTLRFQHFGEHQRETILLHFAEPLQFLHNLDIAHVFEHYYRRHLAARLLRGRSLSLSLERRLVQAFAHCFPHKYPLQMLQDLDDSSVLMDRFCDNELLESLDQLIVQAGTSAKLSLEVLELAQKCSFYRQRTLQVYSLNPCFWPLKQRPLPAFSTLPPPLGPFCEDYTRFFTAVHEHGLQQHEKARRLHWTLYGWASLSHCGLKLVVSTVQMIILLQFNNSQAHSLKSFHDASQLSYQELCDALLALTADRQCVLLTNQPSVQETRSPTLSQEEESYLQTVPFKINTTFVVNPAFPADIARKQKSNKVRFHEVRLVNKSHMNVLSREERTVDLAHVFERRRAIMDSAIVRILKQEKEMSVDNIAVTVIKGCSAGQFERGASFGRFDCDFRDVCSRIDRLIVDGYARRDETNQHMLLYVPDPSVGQEEEIPESLRESDPGQSEEKPQDSPSKEQKGAPEEPGPSKLLPRKRPGANRPAVVKFKRKTQAFTRLYSNEMYDKDDAPLLGMFPTSRSLTVDEVQAQINSLLVTIAQVLKADEDVLEHLLYHCKWNKDTLIQRYLNHASTLMEEAGLAGEPVTSPPSPGKQLSCPVCLQAMPYEDAAWLWCSHACCKSCWQQHMLAQIDLNHALLCSCPVSGCHARPTRAFFLQIFGPGSEAIAKFNKATVRSYVERSGRLTWCRNPQGCDQVLCRGDGMDTGTCSKCHWNSCFSCHFIEAHQPASCAHMTKWMESGGFYEGMDEDSKSKQLAALIAKRCPNCRSQIEKNEGCLNMKCKCGHSFCWQCMKPWKPTHTDYYNCTAKISKAASDHRKFTDYNQRCTAHHKSKMFAEKLCQLVKGISESVPIKTLSFMSDASQLLVQCHKMASYSCIAEFFSEPDSMAYLGFLCENLEGDTNALQAFLENTLLSVPDVAYAIRTLPERKLLDGYRLVSKIENTRDKLLLGFHQQFKLGEASSLKSISEAETAKEQESAATQPTRNAEIHVADEEDEDWDEDEEDEHYSEDNLSYIYSDYDDSLHGYDSYDDPYDSDMFPF